MDLQVAAGLEEAVAEGLAGARIDGEEAKGIAIVEPRIGDGVDPDVASEAAERPLTGLGLAVEAGAGGDDVGAREGSAGIGGEVVSRLGESDRYVASGTQIDVIGSDSAAKLNRAARHHE